MGGQTCDFSTSLAFNECSGRAAWLEAPLVRSGPQGSGVCVPVALYPGRPTGDLNALFSVVFSLCMSHVVGEVTYVELFKDGEGKSRVSVGESARLNSHLVLPVEPIILLYL